MSPFDLIASGTGSTSRGLNTYPPKGYHLEAGRCPNATPDLSCSCNCTGLCRPKLVKDAEPTDQA